MQTLVFVILAGMLTWGWYVLAEAIADTMERLTK